jgi:hypothetical protein
MSACQPTMSRRHTGCDAVIDEDVDSYFREIVDDCRALQALPAGKHIHHGVEWHFNVYAISNPMDETRGLVVK